MAAGGSLDDDKRLDTVRLDVAHPVTAAPDVGHRLVARRLARAGQPEKALAELIRFSRESPMTPRTASALVTLALQTGRTSPILTLLNQGTEETDGVERVGVLRALARLLRRTGQHEAAIETLSMLLAEAAEDRRARLVLNALLEQHQRWEALDASLDKETRLLLKRRYFRAASRTALRRARLWSERLDDAPRAALRFGQAAQYAEQGHDPHSVFLLRMLWLRALVSADAPSRTIDEAAAVTVEAASRVGREARARAFLRELGVAAPAGAAPVPADEVTRIGVPAHLERPAATEGTRPAGETGPRGAVAGALAAAGRSSAVSTEALLRIEARAVAQGAWPELARFYRQTADALPAAERTGWLEKLAELLESELDDPEQAARVWAEVAQLTGAAEAVSEQVRILDGRNDLAGVKQALDAGVGRAQAPAEKARLLVLRAGEARQRGDDAAARADLEAALRVAPGAIEAAAGLAELAVGRGDPGPLKAFERLLASSSRHLPERPELFRRLARLADASKDLRLALSAWGEVLASARGDDEALERSLTLALALKDDARLEPVVRAALEKDPRGARARVAWVELVALLERTARADEALDALRAAVKAEPGHLEVWLALIDRLVARGLDEEAAWAMEQASTAAPDGPRRVSVWRRLARHARERLSDEEKAEKYEERVERVRASQAPAAHAAPGLPGGPLMVPTPRASRPRSPAAPPRTPEDEAESDAFARALGATREPDAARERPIVIPSRLERVLSPMLADVETREAPADEFVDDEDVDDVVDDEGGGLPPLVVPRLKPQLPSGEGARSSLPTRPERAWPDAAADEPRARGRAPETPRAGPPEGPAVVALPRRAGTGASEAVRRGGTGPAPEALTRASAAPDDVDASRSMGRVPAWSEGAAAAGGAARSSDEGAGGALRRDDDEDGAREPSTGRVPAWSEGS
ncbi:MAG: hypothetical protein INH37_14860, partial [Myxococcaceae bacterium]|nr:hypothetical protein [Myxococcaceae bacterium]